MYDCRTEASGEVTLRTTQFLDQLRKNPTLKIMRDELVSVLQEQLEKIGIPPVSSLFQAFRFMVGPGHFPMISKCGPSLSKAVGPF